MVKYLMRFNYFAVFGISIVNLISTQGSFFYNIYGRFYKIYIFIHILES